MVRRLMPFVLPGGSRPILPRPPVYVLKWHRVDDWAYRVLEPMDLYHFSTSRNPRLGGWRGQLVGNIHDAEEAHERGIPLERAPEFSGAPSVGAGGWRRVSIRAMTWEKSEITDRYQALLNPQWITTGWGMSARTAALKHERYIERYQSMLDLHRESRKLIVTAWEIVYWTASQSADYV